MKKLRITVEGKTYDVEVEMLDGGFAAPAAARPAAGAPVAAVAAATPAAAPAAPAAPVSASGDGIPCPLAAIVVSVDVKPGQQVKEGDKIVTLEAMKMNTFVFAPKAGTIGQILVAAGQSVAEGQPLVTFA